MATTCIRCGTSITSDGTPSAGLLEKNKKEEEEDEHYFCGDPRLCNECFPPEGVNCKWCGIPVKNGAVYCTECHVRQKFCGVCGEGYFAMNTTDFTCFGCEFLMVTEPLCFCCHLPNIRDDIYCKSCAAGMRNKCWKCRKYFQSENYSDHLCPDCFENMGEKRRCFVCRESFFAEKSNISKKEFLCQTCIWAKREFPDGDGLNTGLKCIYCNLRFAFFMTEPETKSENPVCGHCKQVVNALNKADN